MEGMNFGIDFKVTLLIILWVVDKLVIAIMFMFRDDLEKIKDSFLRFIKRKGNDAGL